MNYFLSDTGTLVGYNNVFITQYSTNLKSTIRLRGVWVFVGISIMFTLLFITNIQNIKHAVDLFNKLYRWLQLPISFESESVSHRLV